ncbi:c-type cytochrome biogenesis protein CcmI [Ectothiorhodospiraceae bacterium WFHF3C12]|nr:c-type cytochrome biogenesis protein CcmI [Ectothiorhodospiraceae bacterium WFHF3C12]
MVLFYVTAAAMLLLALLFVVLPLIGRRRSSEADDAALNVALSRDRLAELKAERTEGLIADGDYEAARQELEARVLRESEAGTGTRGQGPRWVAAAALIVVPLLAFGLYIQLGTPTLIDPPEQRVAGGDAERGRQILEDRVERLRSRLEDQPEDVEAWSQLGRYYALLRDWPQARQAFGRATELAGESRPDLMVDYAEMLVATSGDSLGPEARSILDRALELDPENEKGRWLLGLARFQDEDYAGAADVWQGLLRELPPDSRRAGLLDQYLQLARNRAGMAATGDTQPASDAGVTARVAVAPNLRERIAPQDTLFVFARAPSGPPMPIAAVRHAAGDLPLEIRLTDADAMTGNRKISDFDTVELVARVTKGGGPRARPGDLEGTAKASPGAEGAVDLRIDRVIE